MKQVPLEQKWNIFVFLYLKRHVFVFGCLVDFLCQGHIVLSTVALGTVFENTHAAGCCLVELLALAYSRVIEVLRSLFKQEFLDLLADTPPGL